MSFVPPVRTGHPLRAGVVLALASLLGACGGGKSPDESLAEAKAAWSQGRYPAAVIELKNALQGNPQLAEARWLLGRAYLYNGNGPAAQKELERAAELGWTGPELKAALLQSLLTQGEFEKALATAPAADAPDASADLLALRAEAEMSLQKFVAAGASLARALELDPGSRTVILQQARLAQAQGDFDAALGHVARAESVDPKWLRAALLRGEIELARGAPEAAEKAYRHALEVVPVSPDARWGIVQSLLAQRRTADARQELKPLRQSYPQSSALLFTEAFSWYLEGQRVTARDMLRKVLAADPNHEPTLLVLANILYGESNYEQAEQLIQQYLKTRPGEEAALMLLASIQISRSRPDKALDTLDKVDRANDGSLTDPQLLALLGTAHVRKGDIQIGTGFLRRAVEASPDEPLLKTQLAMGHMAGGDVQTALSQLGEVSRESDEVTQADAMLIYALIERGRFDEALGAVDRLAEKLPGSAVPDNLRGGIYLAMNKPQDARRHFEAATTTDPAFAAAWVNLAIMALKERRPDDARALLAKAVAANPDDVNAVTMKAELDAAGGKVDAAIETLDKLASKNPKAGKPRLALARLYLSKRDTQRALAAAQAAYEALPNDADVLDTLALVQGAAGLMQESRRTLERRVALGNVGPEQWLLLAEAQRADGNAAAARESAENALTLSPDYPAALIFKARDALDAGKSDLALDIAGKLQGIKRARADGLEIEGDVHVARNGAERAIAAYRDSYEARPGGLIAIKLHRALAATGKSGEGLALLEKQLAADPSNDSVKLVLASAIEQGGDTARAVALYEEILAKSPGNAAVLNNLAWAYRDSNRAKALTLAERAVEAAPGRPEMLDTLGWLLTAEGNTERAIKVLSEAARQAPQAPTIRYHLAIARAKSGDLAGARRELETLLRDDTPFPERADARKLLDTL